MTNIFQVLNVMVVFFLSSPLDKFFQRSVLGCVKCVVKWFPTRAFLAVSGANRNSNSHVRTIAF